ncbi:FtsK/SpoIIIE domain-containing protein [Protofrankia sp. BMG5.30]|uniref:FtsK/SpoIIIE domain-containing protein n=1 Tax=Protofrankia sp. BMG5.30 TaxID=1834514 RepID=UPI0009773582|nr:FtsK/SpoIIIE domain-containing protein [Protofrankia sp. BMG5.30]ONH33268.1 cell division protein FtsK [Protofrankia sp. BMG5.30]
MARINGSRPFPDVPTRHPRVDVPLWVVLVGLAGRMCARLLLFVLRHPVLVGLLLTVLVIRERWGLAGLGLVLLAVVVLAVGWRLAHRRSFAWLTGWLRGRLRLLAVYRWRWRPVMVHTGLAIRVPVSNGDRVAFAETFPRIRTIRSDRWADRLRVELLYGQTPQQWAEQAEALRQAFRAQTCRIRADRVGYLWLDFTHRDPLAELIPPADLEGPDADGDGGDDDGWDDGTPVNLAGIPIGRQEDGQPWRLPVRGAHVLVAGATGAGKSSVLWATIRGLGPAVRAGLVELWVADPKGGMELAFGRDMFTRFATDTAGIADLLDDAVAVMRGRAGRLRGVTRLHTPTTDEPLIVVIVDELAALTAYVTDRELKRRLAASLPLLLSQGRAPGVVVIGAVQDPRKEVLPFRDLFPVRVALRLTEPDQVDLVLGDGARDRGARAEEIPDGLPGVGYVLADGQADPVRVRAAWVDDAEIGRMAHRYRPPVTGTVLGLDDPGTGWTPDINGWAA